jgi:hypothetical protein
MQSCVDDMERALVVLPPPTHGNLAPGITREQYEAARAQTRARLMTECAKRACQFDVRECAKVKDYEEAERKPLPQ